ncbi:MAG: DotU family type IV/VI secretion system protein [Bacteroidetes bacterium]|nr:DotU family type IV/VI secretion system protein [Bacteroidota bacterium]
MQEDKWSTRLGELLRKKQEEAPIPYAPGAWEAFEARRNQKRGIPPIWWWSGGIAASLALILFLGLQWAGENQENQVAVETQTIQEVAPNQSEQSQGNPDSKSREEVPEVFSEQTTEKNRRSEPNSYASISQKSIQILAKNELETQKGLISSTESSSEKFVESISQQALAATSQEASSSTGLESSIQAYLQASLQEEKHSAPTTTTAPNYAEIVPAEAAELLAQQKDPLSFALGLGPGFGTSTASNQVTSGSRIGLGMQVDKSLAGNLRIGSGLGVNYLSQATQGPVAMKLAGVNSPIEGTTQVEQVQVDLPVYLRYALTATKSISVQAGFSNLLTFNQSAQQELIYTRQVAAPADASANSLSTLKSAQVVETSPLAGPSSRFFPFALANLGVNVRVYETKKSNYLLMPFYSYPLQDISGTGQNPAVLGAAVKITFGTLKK